MKAFEGLVNCKKILLDKNRISLGKFLKCTHSFFDKEMLENIKVQNSLWISRVRKFRNIRHCNNDKCCIDFDLYDAKQVLKSRAVFSRRGKNFYIKEFNER